MLCKSQSLLKNFLQEAQENLPAHFLYQGEQIVTETLKIL